MSRKEKIMQLFKHNTVLKVLSIGIAFLIWLVVVNISDPEVTETVSSEISVLYEDELTGKSKTYTLDTKTVKISYKVRSSYRRQVHPSDFNAYIDLRDLSITGAVPVYVEVSNNANAYISNDTVSPIVVHVDTEDMVEKSFDIETKLTGTPAEGKIIGPVSLSSDTITLFGPSSELNSIDKAVVYIPTDGAAGDISGTGSPVFYDSSGNEISLSEKTLLKNSVDYSAVLYTKKDVSVNAAASGSPADGYRLDGVTVSPSYVVIYGTDDAVAACSSISIPATALDVSGANKNVTASLNISKYVPQNVYLEGSGEITIVASISKQEELSTEASEEGSEAASEADGTESDSEASETETSDATESSAEDQKIHPDKSIETISDTQQGTRQHISETRARVDEENISELQDGEMKEMPKRDSGGTDSN